MAMFCTCSDNWTVNAATGVDGALLALSESLGSGEGVADRKFFGTLPVLVRSPGEIRGSGYCADRLQWR